MLKAFLLLLCYAVLPQVTGRERMTVFTWPNYMDNTVAQAFERQHNTSLHFEFFETDDARDRYLAKKTVQVPDLIILNTTAIPVYKKRKLIGLFDKQRIPNLNHIDPYWLEACHFPSGIPYFWGTLGFVYNRAVIKQKLSKWKDIFEPADGLKGKIMMIDDPEDSIGMALKSLGYSMNSLSRKEIKAAEHLLAQQKPYVNRYGYPLLTANSALVSGHVLASMVYSGDYFLLKQHNKDLEFVQPAEGSGLWVDCFALYSHSQSDQAHAFLNFINKPEIAAQNAQAVFHATANETAKQYIDKAFLNNPVIYPNETFMKKSEPYKKAPPKHKKLLNATFFRIKH